MSSPSNPVSATAHPRILVIEHEAKCPVARVATWLVEAGCQLDECRPWAGDVIPDARSYDAVVVLGGTMGADDDATHPWLTPVKQLIRDVSDSEVPTLGICLGHQLIAVALGGTVEVNARGQQLGLLDVGWTPARADDALFSSALPGRGIHWNNDTVTTLPDGAALLATTAHEQPQVVRFAPNIWGVQLHPEADEHIVGAWAEGDREMHSDRGVDQAALLGGIAAARAELDQIWRPVVHRFAALAAEANRSGTP